MKWSEFRQARMRSLRPLVVAHRGASALAPENTWTAFSMALAQGADALETDLRFTSDGQIILFHDSTLDRTTDGHGPVADLTLNEIKQRKVKTPNGTLSYEEYVLTLDELIMLTRPSVPLLLELKDPQFMDPQKARRLVALLEKSGAVERCAIVSFDLPLVQSVKALCPAIPSGIITRRNPLPSGDGKLFGPFWPLLLLNPFYVAMAHRRSGVVCPLDPNPESRLDLFMKLGVDAILANHPQRVLDAMRGRLA